MSSTDTQPPANIQDFIFARELAEVYLLLDHMSGRADKSLKEALGTEANGKDLIQEICEIGWPPTGTQVQQALQAATLLMARDKLNTLARPANGASIAFTLLVTADDEPAQIREKRQQRLWSRMVHATSRMRSAVDGRTRPSDVDPTPDAAAAAASTAETSASPSAAPATSASVASPQGDTQDSVAPTAQQNRAAPAAEPAGGAPSVGETASGFRFPDVWGGALPSRTSLAQLAYPGLIMSAWRFRWIIRIIIALLLFWLIVTCGLSWNVAAGHAMLTHLQALEAERELIASRISDAEKPSNSPETDQSPASPPPPSPGATPADTTQSERKYLHYCSRITIEDGKTYFESAQQQRLCYEQFRNDRDYEVGLDALADWLSYWDIVIEPSRGSSVAAMYPVTGDATNRQWASVLLDVLANAVLPLCYGFLGAGAAVVRNIWAKMSASLLSPRDLTLALGQLALGAVIGACIGLFVTPTGADATSSGGLTGSVTLTASALSFIAGFGVEGIFVALEGLIRRIFNLPDPATA